MTDSIKVVKFDCKELEQAPEWDGHTPDDGIARIATLGAEERTCNIKKLDALAQTLAMANFCAWGECSVCGCIIPDDSLYCMSCGARVIA